MTLNRAMFWTVIHPLCLLGTLVLGACGGIELAQWVTEKLHFYPNQEETISIGIAAICAALPTHMLDRFITKRMRLHG